jgi:hypothetical protein
MTGMLICHDFIYGYNEYRNKPVLKAKRIFCSNRNNRKGCGRTITYLIIDFIKKTFISTTIAWKFLLLILSKKSIEKAYDSLDPECTLSLSTFLRFFKKFKLQTHRIRTNLANNYPIIKTTDICPYKETIRQLETIFNNTDTNPISIYQNIFQTSII